MMIKITNEQAVQLQGFEIAKNWLCKPVQDINGKWFIGSPEAAALGIEGVETEYVAPIYDELNG